MERIALKIQRRRYTQDAVEEIDIHDRIRSADGTCREIITLREAFLHGENVCMAFDRHGRSLESALSHGPLPLARARRVTRQMLLALDQLHRCGYTHTDIKPDNILYDPRTGNARLADLGSATDRLRQGSRRGTREYLAPEVLIGAPLSSKLDLWSLGCTIFEMITGRLLFCPREVAARKYREFSNGSDWIEVPRDERVIRDEAEEAAEQLSRGTVIADRYKLERVLGQGRFGTVWSAQALSTFPQVSSRDALRDYARRVDHSAPTEGEYEHNRRQWRRKKGADDILDLALNYEHTLLIAALCGPFPQSLAQCALYRASYFEEDGEPRFRPEIRRTSLRERLRRQGHLSGETLHCVTDFLEQLLRVDPTLRTDAATALRHSWLCTRRKNLTKLVTKFPPAVT